jgi:hypothetical protein
MAHSHRPKSARPKGSWGKRIGIGIGVLVVLLLLTYFIGTSSAFVKAVILPKVSTAMNARVTVGDISVSPFSQVHIQQLRVETTGTEPLLTAQEVRLRYSLMDIIGGNINVDEVTLGSPVVTIVEHADGSSNLDPILKREKKEEKKPDSDEPTKLSVKNVSLKNGTVRQIARTKLGGTSRTELQGLNISLDRLGNGQSGNLKLQTAFSMEQREAGTNSLLAGEISGGYDVALNQDLLPETVKGSMQMTVARAEGNVADLAGLRTSLDADLTPTEIRQVALRFAKGGQQLGQVRLSGPLDLEKREGTIKLEVASLDKNFLALAAAGKGYDFRNSTISSTNQIAISQKGSFFAANGNVAGNKVSVTKETLTTPEMDVNMTYQVSVNTTDKSALLEKLNIAGSYGGKEFLRTTLDQQMNLSWGETVKGYKDASLRMVMTNFNLADWRAVLGTNLQAGTVNATIGVVSQRDGRLLTTDLNARIAELSANFGTNQLQGATVTLESAGTIEDLKVINLSRYALALQQSGNPVLQASGAARYETEQKQATAQLTAEGNLARLLALAAMPDAKATGGQLKVNANYTDVGGKRKANGNLALEGFTGSYGEYAFTNFQTAFEYNVEMENQVVEIHRAAARFAQGFNAGGNLDLKGRYDLGKKTGEFTFQTVDLNQNTFGPVLAPSLGENRLVSISLNASGEANVDPQSETGVKANVKVANWVVHDREGKLPKTPLSVDLRIDGAMRKETLDLRELLVQLTPNARAKNALRVVAKLDFAKTNPAPSTASVRSESFDVTPYYNMFAGGTKTNENTAPVGRSGSPAAPATSEPEKEPEPMNLPFRQLAADLKIDRLYLREIAISNWVGNVTIRSNVVQLNPFQLQLNGGAMDLTGNFDVGQPGYKYELGFKADNVPLGPLANSFELASSNQLQGTFIADARLRGLGTTGPNLRKNLGGSFNVNLTNLNYLPGGPKLRRILVPISLALRVPELTETPINWVAARTQITNGTVRVENASIESEAFFANVTGTITLADVITNSTLNLPIDFSLRRSLAEKTKILPSNTLPDAPYARLGNIYTVRGTVGVPDPDANKAVLAGIALQGAAGFGLGNEKTEKALGAIGNILTGQKSATTSTNAGSTNASPAGNLLEGLGGLLGGKSKSTNAPATNQPPRSNPIGDLLRGLPGTKQQ